MTPTSNIGRQTGRRQKVAKGTIKVEADKGWLRLRFTYQGKRKALALGLPDSKANRIFAEQKACQIEKDIYAGHFDDSLARYKPEKQSTSCQSDSLTVVALFREFLGYKAKEVTPKTMEKYWATFNYLEQFLANKSVQSLIDEDVEAFVKWQTVKGLSESQIKRRIEELKACWRWHEASHNPWSTVAKRIKVPPKQKPKPFTKQEIDVIIKAFTEDKRYCFYLDLVKFLLWTGCRTGEAIGLRWKHLHDDCSSIWIGEILTRGKRRPVKRDKDRSFALNSKVQELLSNRKPQDAQPDDLVFLSPEGVGIDDHNFSQRIWRKILERSSIPHRKFYNTRHTFTSHALESGMNPVLVAEITGHSDVKTLYTSYAGIVNSRPTLPDF